MQSKIPLSDAPPYSLHEWGGFSGATNYLASYLGKVDQTRPGDFTGRYWGTFARTRLPVGELHTLQLTPQQWAKVRRLARKKMGHDINQRRWFLFFKDVKSGGLGAIGWHIYSSWLPIQKKLPC